METLWLKNRGLRHRELAMWFAYEDQRKISTREEVIGSRLQVRRCVNRNCARYHVEYLLARYRWSAKLSSSKRPSG